MHAPQAPPPSAPAPPALLPAAWVPIPCVSCLLYVALCVVAQRIDAQNHFCLQAAPGATPITVAYGDGIGPEIMAASLKVLESAGAKLDIDVIQVGEAVSCFVLRVISNVTVCRNASRWRGPLWCSASPGLPWPYTDRCILASWRVAFVVVAFCIRASPLLLSCYATRCCSALIRGAPSFSH